MTTRQNESEQTIASVSELDAAVASLTYEEARAELVQIVGALEQGNIPLEQSVAMWERGEALARRCDVWLAGARERLARACAATDTDSSENTEETKVEK